MMHLHGLLVFVVAVALLALPESLGAQEVSTEIWPELDTFVKLLKLCARTHVWDQ